MRLVSMLYWIPFALGSPAAGAAADSIVQDSAAQPAGRLEVYLMTIGQGDAIWEKFGHNALWLVDRSTGYNLAFNYGMFSFDEPGYLKRFLKGDMQYWTEAFDGDVLAGYYVESNRSIWVQELDLTPAEKAELRTFLEWNAREENKYYRYDYYRDNCSTRVRDAIDRVIGGAIRASLDTVPTGTTYRWHTSRLTADALAAYTGLLLGLGPYVDEPISAWEEGFLPVRLMEHLRTVTVSRPDGSVRALVRSERQVFAATRAPEREAPPNRTIPYAIAGLVGGSLLLLAGRATPRRRAAALAFFTLALAWSLAAGVFGSIISAVWAFTDHAAGYDNANVLQVNTLSLVLVVLLGLATTGRAYRAARLTALAIAVLASFGLILQLTPWEGQANGEIIGLALPIHLGLTAGLYSVTRARPAT